VPDLGGGAHTAGVWLTAPTGRTERPPQPRTTHTPCPPSCTVWRAQGVGVNLGHPRRCHGRRLPAPTQRRGTAGGRAGHRATGGACREGRRARREGPGQQHPACGHAAHRQGGWVQWGDTRGWEQCGDTRGREQWGDTRGWEQCRDARRGTRLRVERGDGASSGSSATVAVGVSGEEGSRSGAALGVSKRRSGGGACGATGQATGRGCPQSPRRWRAARTSAVTRSMQRAQAKRDHGKLPPLTLNLARGGVLLAPTSSDDDEGVKAVFPTRTAVFSSASSPWSGCPVELARCSGDVSLSIEFCQMSPHGVTVSLLLRHSSPPFI